MKDLVSIIIPVYNVEKYLKKCLDSVINQTYSNLEIILINDGSTDNSLKICEEFRNIDERIKIINKENGGVSNARNVGIDLSSGKYIIFIDSDDYIEKDMVEVLYNEINKNNIDLAFCGYYLENENFSENKYLQCKEILNKNELFENIVDFIEGITGYIWNKIFKAEIVKKNNLKFDNTYSIGEDMLFCVDYIKYCESGKLCEKLLYHYMTINNQSAINKKINEKYIKSILDSYDEIIKIYSSLNLDNKIINLVKEKYIDTFKGCVARATESKFENKEILKIYKKKSIKYFKEIKKNLSKNKIIRNYISLYFPRFYLMLFNIKNKKRS